MGLKRIYGVLLVFLFTGLSILETRAQCTRSPNAIAGFVPDQTCQPVSVRLESVSHTPIGGPNNIPVGTTYTIDWGDGTVQSYTTTINGEPVPAFMQDHEYGPADTDCSYILRFEISNACGADFISSTVNVHDTDEMGLAITQDYTVCEGYGGTFTFTDATAMNCLAPPFGDANDENRTIRWDYGTGSSTIPGVTAGGFDASSSVHQGTAYTVAGPGSTSLAVVIPAASTVGRDGEYFEVTMYNWNSCNPYDDPGVGGPPADLLNGDNPPVSITARITVVASPPAPAAADRDYCFGAVGPLTASAGFGGVLRWYENATLSPEGIVTSGTHVSNGGTFAHGQTAAGTYTYWVTETLPGTNCEGPATEVTLNIREDLEITDAITGDDNVCPGETGLTYSLPNPPTAQPVGGNTEYIWSLPSGWHITGGQGTESITVESTTTAVSGNISVVWQFTSAPPCTSGAEILPVTVNVLPAGNIRNIPNNQTICEGNAPDFTIELTQGVGNTGPFEVDYTDGTNTFTETLAFGDNTVTPGIDPPPGVTTNYTITEIRDLAPNGCTVTASNPQQSGNITGSASVFVRSDLVITDPIAGPTEVCPGDMVTFSLPNPPPLVDGLTTIYQWQLPNTAGSDLGTITSGNNTESINVTVGNNTGTKRVRVRWRYANQPRCSSPWVQLFVNVNIQPEAEISGDQSICLGDNPVLTFSNLVGVGGIGPFDIDYTPDGGTTIHTATNVPIAGGTVNAPPPAAAGNYTYTIQEIRDLGANGCVSTAPSANISGSANVTVRETLNLTDPITGPSNVCANEIGVNFTLPGAPPVQPAGGATEYQWTVPAGWTITGGQGTESITVDIGSSTGPGRIVSVVWQYPGSPNCTSNTQSTSITVDPGPTVATVGPDLDYCTALTLISVGLGGNSPLVGTGAWSQVSGPSAANITNPADPNTTVSIASAADAGVYVFRWSITSGTCPPSTADVTVDFGTAAVAPDAYTPSDPNEDATCGLTIGLNGSTPLNSLGGPANGQWTQLPGPGNSVFDDDTDPTTNVTVDAYGTYTYRWTVTSGACPAAISDVEITFYESAVVTIPADFEQCINLTDLATTNITTTGTVSGSVSTGTWSVVGGSGAGTGTITTNDLTGGVMELVYEPVAGDLNETLVFQLASADPLTSCTVVTGQFTVTIKQEPNITNATAPSGNIEQVICSGGTAALALSSDGPATVQYNWTASGSSANVTGFSASNSGDISEILLNSGTDIEVVTYVITPSLNGCTGPSVNFVVTVNPTPTTQPDKTAETICDNGTTSIDLTAGGVAVTAGTGTSYTWTVTNNPLVDGESGDASGTLTVINQTLDNTTNTTQTVTYTVTPMANLCPGPTTDIVVTVRPEPTFTNAGTEAICSGDQLNFEPSGDVGSTNFNWITTAVGPDIGGHSASGSGRITDILTNTSDAPQTITYEITPEANGCTGTMGTYIVTVNPKPEITNLPAGAQALCSGGTFTFNPNSNITVGATTYSWTVSSTGTIHGLPGPGTHTGSISHTLTNPGTSVETVTYSITARANGCDSDPALVSVVVSPVADVSNSSLADAICDGEALNFRPESNVFGATFNWTASVTAGSVTNFTPNGSGDITDQLYNTASAIGEVTYEITPRINGCDGTPEDYVVTVKPSPEVTNPMTDEICSNDEIHITPTSDVGGGAATFSWTAVASSPFINGFTPVETGASEIREQVKNTGTSPATVTYKVTAHHEGCSGTEVDFVITVNPEPGISNSGTELSQVLCSGDAATFTPNETVSGTTFAWQVSVTSGTATSANITAVNGTGPINDVITNTGNVDAVVTYEFTPSTTTATTCDGPKFFYVATVKPVAVVDNLPATDVICSGESLNFTPTSPITNIFSWSSADNPNVSGESASGAGAITDNLTNNSDAQQPVTYTVTPMVDGCPGTPGTYTVNVNPRPRVTNSPLTEEICSGDALSVNLGGSVLFGTGTTFTWTSTAGPNINLNNASGSGDITDILTNDGPGPETVVYEITPRANNCDGDQVNYTVTVHPIPNITNPVSDLTDEICSGSTTSFSPAGDVALTDFNWTVTAPITISSGNADFNNGSGAGAISHDLINSGFNVDTVTYEYTPSTTNCTGVRVTYTVTVKPTPNINNSPGNQTICSTDNFTYDPQGDVGSTTFGWTSSSSSPNLVGNTSSGNGQINDVLINNGTEPATITYRITPSANNCDGPVETIVITVNPRPSVIPSVFSQEICHGETTNIALGLNVTGTTFSWTIENAGPDIGGAAGGSGNAIMQTLTNAGAATQTVDYRITPRANNCDGNPLDITVTVHPTPVTSAISSLSGAVDGCINSANVYRVDGAAGTPGSSYRWSISPLNGDEPLITSFNNNAILDFGANPWSGTLTVVETSNGCDGPPVNLAVQSFSTPIVDAGADQEICLGATIQLGGSPTASGGSGPANYEYRWTPAAGLNDATASNPNATPTSTVIYTVDVTDLVTGCTATDQVRVDIVLPPTQPFISVPSGSPFVCKGDSVTLQSSNIGANSYQWYKDGLPLTGEINQTLVLSKVTTTDAGNYQVLTIGTNPVGSPCQSPLSLAQTVEVNQVPAKPTITVLGTLPFCDNVANLAILQASADPLADSYEWYFDDGSGFNLIGGQNTNQIIVNSHTQSGTYYVRAIGVGNSYCAGPDSDPETVLIHQSPDIPVWSGPPYACSDTSIPLQVNFTAGTAPYTIEFQDDQSNNFGPFTVNNGDNISIIPVNNEAFPVIRTYSLTSVTDDNGCSPPNFGTPFQLEVRPLPVASAITGQQNVCVNETGVIYQVTPSAGSQYVWSTALLPGVSVANGGGSGDSFIELNFGSTQILGGSLLVSEINNDCPGPASQLTINVFEPAVADAGSDRTICIGKSVVIGGAPTASGGSGPTNYDITWSPNLSISDVEAANPTVSPSTTTDYTVTVRDTLSGCTVSTSTVRVNVNPLPVITFNPIPGICSAGLPYELIEASPPGGEYSGPGVSETAPGSGIYEFNPSAVASNTPYTITYTYIDGNGCENFNTATIQVYDDPTITLNPFADVCIDAPAFTLGGGFANGVDISTLTEVTYAYWGPGVSETPPGSGIFEFDPAAAGSGSHTISLSFSDANGCNALTNATATITVNPLPVVTMDPLPNQGICELPYTLTEGRVGGAPVAGGRYYEMNGIYVTEPSPGTFVFDPGAAGVGTHDIIYEYQDPATGCMNSVTGQIVVEDYPVISLAPFPDVGLCTAPFTLSGGLPIDQNRTALENGVYSGPGVSETAPGSGIYEFNPANAGVGIHLIKYDYTDQYNCTNFGDGKTITVKPLPLAVFAPVENICVDAAPIELTTGQPGGGVYSGSGVSETFAGSGVYEFDPHAAGVGTHILDYEVSDGFGCSTTEQQTIIVTDLPSGTLTATGTFCNGGPLQFELTGVAPFDLVYEDDKGNSFNVVNVGNIYVQNVDPTENTTYTLVSVTDRYGCTQTSLPPAAATITITPVASFDVDPPLQILPGKTVTITNNTNPGNWTYTWQFGDGNTLSGSSGPVNITHPNGALTTGTIENPVHTYATYGNYLPELTVTDGNCVGEATNIVTIEPLPPVVDFDIDVASGCAPVTVTFTNLTEFADEDAYLWQFGEGEGFSNAQNPTYIYNNPGVYTVTLTAFNELGIAVTATREMAVEVFEQPQARFSVRPTTIYLPDKPVFFTNLSFGGDSYLWDFGDGNTSTEFEPIHIYENPGIYDVSLTVFNGDQCPDIHTIEEAVIALNGGDIKVPTVFTPDPGGPNGGNVSLGTVENNVFIPLIEGAVEFRMEVYSRWGELMFATNSQTVGWDGYYKGKMAKQGVYLYKVTATFRDGERITRVGDVTLLR